VIVTDQPAREGVQRERVECQLDAALDVLGLVQAGMTTETRQGMVVGPPVRAPVLAVVTCI
jgi:hypothetical protein